MEESKAAKAVKTPAILNQLKQENELLREELRKLSGDLDGVLLKQTKKAVNPAEGNCQSVRTKELQIARTQVQHYEKEMASLRRQLETNSAERAQELEAEVVALTTQIREKENSIRAEGRKQKVREDELETMEGGPETVKEIQSLTEQLKVRKSKLEKLESTISKEEEFCKQSRDKVLELEGKINGFQGPSSPDEDAEPNKLPVVKSDLETIKSKVAQLEANREAELAKWRKRIADSETAVKSASEAKERLQTDYQNREQLSRILESKVKELKRSVHMVQKRNEMLTKSTAPDMNIDPEAVANSGPAKEESSVKSLRKSSDNYSSKPNLGY